MTIELGNIGSEEQAIRIKEVLQGKTFYNFRVDYSSYMGNWPVSVTTDDTEATEADVTAMVLFVLASAVAVLDESGILQHTRRLGNDRG